MDRDELLYWMKKAAALEERARAADAGGDE